MNKSPALKAVAALLLAAAVFAYTQFTGPAPSAGKPPAKDVTSPHGMGTTVLLVPATTPRAAPHYDLAKDEGRGHTLKKHVGRTDQQLVERLRQETNISSASSYTDKDMAELCVGAALEQNKTRVQNWVRGNDETRLTLDFKSYAENPIGRVMRRNATQAKPAHRARVVLAKDGRGGFFVLTSYPED